MNQMELNRKELKRKAKEQMRKASPKFYLFTLAYLLLTMGPSLVADITGGSTITLDSGIPFFPLFLSLLLTLYRTVMNFGYEWWALKSYRGEQGDYGCLIDGFSMAFRVILLQIMVFLRMFLWILVGIVPSSILIAFVIISLPETAAIILYILYFVVVFLYTYCMTLRYDMTIYVLMDQPEKGAGYALTQGVAMMRGFLWEYVKLNLSFLGWYLLDFIITGAVLCFFIWPQVASLVVQGNVMTDASQFSAVIYSSTIGSVASTLASIPIYLWLQPFHRITVAGFYHHRAEQFQTMMDIHYELRSHE